MLQLLASSGLVGEKRNERLGKRAGSVRLQLVKTARIIITNPHERRECVQNDRQQREELAIKIAGDHFLFNIVF